MDAADFSGASSIYLAAQNGHMEVVEALLQAQADANASLSNGCTPLYIAEKNKHTQVCKVLRDAGAVSLSPVPSPRETKPKGTKTAGALGRLRGRTQALSVQVERSQMLETSTRRGRG